MPGDARDGVAAIASNGEQGGNLDRAVWGGGADTSDGAIRLLNEAGGLPPHAQGKCRKPGGLGGEEVKEVPLRHERNEFCVCGQVVEVCHDEGAISDEAGELSELRVRQSKEFFEEAELVKQLERGGVNGVAAKVAEEVFVLFENRDRDTGAGEKEA